MNATLRSKKNKKDFAVSSNRRTNTRNNSRSLLPALVALGGSCGIVCGPVWALELGDIDVQSTLGQPLRASIAFALNPNEQIHDYCIYLKPGLAANGLPSVSHASIAVSNGAILLTGHTAIRDPLVSVQLTVDCPYAANLSRQYTAFVNPQSYPRTEPVLDTAVVPLPATTNARVANNAATRSTTPVRSANREPVAKAGTYRVQRGDTLSGIAERISGRSVSIWQAADTIFAANPGAFIDDDMNLLKAGAMLVIPGTLRAADVVAPKRPAASEQTADTEIQAVGQTADATAYAGYRPGAAVNAEAPSRDTILAEPAAMETTRAPRAGDISVGADGPFVAPIESTIESTSDTSANSSPFKQPTEVIPETSIEVPATPPAAASGSKAAGARAGNSWSWALWLGGSGIALILGLLLFGRKSRGRFERATTMVSDEPRRGRRRNDGDSHVLPADDASQEIDFRFDEPSGARVIALDGDLDAGTGFQDSSDIDVAQDFGFSASGDFQMGLDIEFSADEVVRLDEEMTDIGPLNRRATDTILVHEVPPGNDEEGSEYDLSMVVDATRQPVGDTDETTKDLKAIELDADSSATADDDPYTLTKEVDYKILEQDYEEELTATQALSAELAQAARALSAKLNIDADESENRELSDLDDTSVNEEVTTEMPLAENDAMADMDIESATIDTKKMKAS